MVAKATTYTTVLPGCADMFLVLLIKLRSHILQMRVLKYCHPPVTFTSVCEIWLLQTSKFDSLTNDEAVDCTG